MTDVQADADGAQAEHARLVDTPLPDRWLDIAMAAAFPGLPAGMTLDQAERRLQAAINAVLPLVEQAVREQVAREVRYGGPTRLEPRDV